MFFYLVYCLPAARLLFIVSMQFFHSVSSSSVPRTRGKYLNVSILTRSSLRWFKGNFPRTPKQLRPRRSCLVNKWYFTRLHAKFCLGLSFPCAARLRIKSSPSLGTGTGISSTIAAFPEPSFCPFSCQNRYYIYKYRNVPKIISYEQKVSNLIKAI